MGSVYFIWDFVVSVRVLLLTSVIQSCDRETEPQTIINHNDEPAYAAAANSITDSQIMAQRRNFSADGNLHSRPPLHADANYDAAMCAPPLDSLKSLIH